MIKLYTSEDFFDKKEILHDNEVFFNIIPTKSYTKYFDNILLEVDNARIIDRRIGTVVTPFGSTSIRNVSTGCKTALNVVYLHEVGNSQFKAVSLNECGLNALEAIFDYADLNSVAIAFILEHRNKTSKCKKRDYFINGVKHVDNIGLIG